jgi:hypothetical protein
VKPRCSIGAEAYGPIVEAAMGFERRFTREQLEGTSCSSRWAAKLNLRRAEEIHEQARARQPRT